MVNNIILYILEGIHNHEEPKFHDFDIDKETFGEIVETMQSDGLISGAKVSRVGLENKVAVVTLQDVKVELKGLNYIKKYEAYSNYSIES